MGRVDRREPFLQNLGRATMRGLRRCQKCGTLNGTRGYSCKNKSCDVVFKEGGERKKRSTESCKINAGNSAQIYSVRVRDKGPDYRGFVQLPSFSSSESSPDFMLCVGNDAFYDSVCYVESCQKKLEKGNNKEMLFTEGSYKQEVCAHIQAATNCVKDSKSFFIKNSVLNSLPISEEEKAEIWHLNTDTPGPLVQRVSKNIMVVKCKPSHSHPLGFLHFSFLQSRNKDDSESRYFCGCHDFRSQISGRDSVFRKCIHFYACVLSFSSDPQLSQEFSYIISLVYGDFGNGITIYRNIDMADGTRDDSIIENDCDDSVAESAPDRSYLILNDSEDSTCQVEVEVLDDHENILGLATSLSSEEEMDDKFKFQLKSNERLQLTTSDGETISLQQTPKKIVISGTKRAHEEVLTQSGSPLLRFQDISGKKRQQKKKSSFGGSKKHRKQLDESCVNLPFSTWLSNVTQQINQTMHFGFPGSPPPLVFQIPPVFFECLLDRMAAVSRKYRTPTRTESVERKDFPPFGVFTKHIWKVFNLQLIHLVFSTPSVALNVSRTFLANSDGSYKPFDSPVGQEEERLYAKAGPNQVPLKPHEIKTVLWVGSTVPGQKTPTPFVIEWIPNLYSETEFGELRIQFQFYHVHNGVLIGQKPLQSSELPPLRPTSTLIKFPGHPIAPKPIQVKKENDANSVTTISDEGMIGIPIAAGVLRNSTVTTVLSL